MKLKVIGTGSSGNCYLLENESDALVIEAGVNPKFVKQTLDFRIWKIDGAISSHRHSDHAKYLEDYRKMGILVVDPEYIGEEGMLNRTFRFGDFTIKAFKLIHDVPCYGYWIHHPDMGSLVYATDTELIPFLFSGVNHILVEANYSIDSISDDYDAYYHVLQGHHSIEACCDFLRRHDEESIKNVILCHLSERNGKDEEFKKMAQESFGKYKPDVYIAKKGLCVDVSI